MAGFTEGKAGVLVSGVGVAGVCDQVAPVGAGIGG